MMIKFKTSFYLYEMKQISLMLELKSNPLLYLNFSNLMTVNLFKLNFTFLKSFDLKVQEMSRMDRLVLKLGTCTIILKLFYL